MGRVTVGVDPHKRSVTLEVIDEQERILAKGTFGTGNRDYQAMRRYVRSQWPHHRWAVEGAQGVGRPLAQRLLADGETVIDVPAKLAARMRVFDTGNARKTDEVDAHSVAVTAVRTPKLKVLSFDEELVALRLLVDRRDELSALRVQTLNRLHRLLAELIPGGAAKNLSASKAKVLLSGVRPRTLLGKTTRRMAAEELADLVRVHAKVKALDREIKATVTATGSHLMDLHGVGPAGAARILADVGDVARFPDRAHFASWTGTAPLDASSGEQIRHRLSRAGNRRLIHVLHIAAITQIRYDCEGRRYYRRKLSEAKTPREALRCLIGGVSRTRSGPMSGRGSRSCRGMASLPRPVRASFSSATPGAPRPLTGVRNMPDRGPNNEEPARGLDTDESTIDSTGEATDAARWLGLGKPHSRCHRLG